MPGVARRIDVLGCEEEQQRLAEQRDFRVIRWSIVPPLVFVILVDTLWSSALTRVLVFGASLFAAVIWLGWMWTRRCVELRDSFPLSGSIQTGAALRLATRAIATVAPCCNYRDVESATVGGITRVVGMTGGERITIVVRNADEDMNACVLEGSSTPLRSHADAGMRRRLARNLARLRTAIESELADLAEKPPDED